MKKWIVYILSLTALVVSLCACGTADKPAATNAPGPSGWRTRRPNRPPLRRRRMAQQKSEKHPAGSEMDRRGVL